MSREFYQDGWGRRKNKYKNRNNNSNNCPCNNNEIDAVDACNIYQENVECIKDTHMGSCNMPINSCNTAPISCESINVDRNMSTNCASCNGSTNVQSKPNTPCDKPKVMPCEEPKVTLKQDCNCEDTSDTNQNDTMEDCTYNEISLKKNAKNTKSYNEAKEAPLEGSGQMKCCPFDAYGLNTYNSYYTHINVVKDHIEDLCIPFTVSVTIPVGFVLPQNCCYERNLAMDKHDLSVNLMTQYYVYADVDSCDPNNTEVVKMQIAVLNGPIYYNVTVENFVPAQGIQDVNQSLTPYFNNSGSLAIDKIIAYIPFGYENTTAPYYTVDVVAEKETVTLPGGKCVSKKSACDEFKCILSNPDVERILNFSYVLVIKSRNMC